MVREKLDVETRQNYCLGKNLPYEFVETGVRTHSTLCPRRHLVKQDENVEKQK